MKHFSMADVIVHRLLAAALGIYKLPGVFQDRPQLTSIADSMDYFLLFYLEGLVYLVRLIVRR